MRILFSISVLGVLFAAPTFAGADPANTVSVRPGRTDRTGCLVAVTESPAGMPTLLVGTRGLRAPLTWRLPLGTSSNGFNEIRTALLGKVGSEPGFKAERFEIALDPSDFARFGAVREISVELTDRAGKSATCSVPSEQVL